MTDFLKNILTPRLGALALVLLLFQAAASAQQQRGTPKKEPAPNAPTTTGDAWRQALPAAEQPAMPVDETAVLNEAEETFGEVEKRLDRLERRWMEAVKLRDAALLGRLLADDFTHADAQTAGAAIDKAKYIEHALRDLKLNSYSFDSLTVRVYGQTAIVNASYKQQALVAGAEASGDFLVTDVWAKRDNRWRVVARHVSQSAKAQDKR